MNGNAIVNADSVFVFKTAITDRDELKELQVYLAGEITRIFGDGASALVLQDGLELSHVLLPNMDDDDGIPWMPETEEEEEEPPTYDVD